MPSYSQSYYIIKTALQRAFSEQDLSSRLSNIQIVKTQIQDFLQRYDIISGGIYSRYRALADQLPQESESTRRYQAVKSFNQQTNAVQDLLKQGYLYVDALRQAFTGESIAYQVALIDNGFLYEGSMDILELIQHSTIDVDSRISIQNAAKLRMTKVSAQDINNSTKTSIFDVTESASSVYSAVHNYMTNSHSTPKHNQGNAYEVYQRVLFERNGKNTIPPNTSPQQIAQQIDRIYEQVKRNNAAYYKGGDIANIQVKYLGGKPPSLTTLASIKTVLTKSSAALDVIYQESKPKKKIVNSFVNMFTQKSDKLFTEAEKTANEKAKQTIKDRLDSIAGIAVTLTK